MLQWIRDRSTKSQVVLSVCTGALTLGDAGILKRKKATNHLIYDQFQSIFSEVLIQKNKRFVESDPVIITAGGLSRAWTSSSASCSCMAEPILQKRQQLLEYEGTGWKDDRVVPESTARKLN